MNRTPDYSDLQYMNDEEYVAMMKAKQEGRMVNLHDYFPDIMGRTEEGVVVKKETKPPAPVIPYVSVEMSDEATTFLYSVIDESNEWMIALMGTYDISDKGINFVVEDFVLPMQTRSGAGVEMIKFDVAEKLYEKQQVNPALLYIGIAHLHPRNMNAYFSSTDNEEIDSQKALLPVGFSIVFSPFQKKFISTGESYEPIEYDLKVWVNKTVVSITDHDCILGNIINSKLDFYKGTLKTVDVLTDKYITEKDKLLIGRELGFSRKYMQDYTYFQSFAAREFVNNDFTEEDIRKVTELYKEALKKKVTKDDGTQGQ